MTRRSAWRNSGPTDWPGAAFLVRHRVMPGRVEEAEAIFRWLATEISPDTCVNVMGQYRPEVPVGRISSDGSLRYAEINRGPTREEISAASVAARAAGLWRLDDRRAE